MKILVCDNDENYKWKYNHYKYMDHNSNDNDTNIIHESQSFITIKSLA